MPIVPTALEQQFSNLSTADIDESKPNEPVISGLVTPTKSEPGDESFLSDESSEGSPDKAAMTKRLFQKTDHKMQEDHGLMDDEPLLKENPHRFVIFPIQDNEVSRQFFMPLASAVIEHLKDHNDSHNSYKSSGKCTRKQRPPSGHPKKSIWVVT